MSCLLVSTGLWQFLHLSLSFTALTLLECSGQILGRLSLNFSLSDVFSWLDRGYRFWGRRPQKWRVLLFTSYQWHTTATWLTIGNVEIDHLTSLNFLICTFPYCFSSYNKYVKTVNLQVLINRRPPQMWGLNFLFDQENWCPRLEEGRGDKYSYSINV